MAVQQLKSKYEMLIQSFIDSDINTKTEFIEKSFNTVFHLIDEAEKGSYYERQGDFFVPMLSNGYDMDTLKRLKFNTKDAFIDFESTDDQLIDSYEVHIRKRDDAAFTEDVIATFKALGTYENFRSLYAPVKLGRKKVGLICLENFSDKSFSQNSKLLLRLFAQQYSNIYTLKHYKELSEQKLQSVVKVLVRAIELKDAYTMGHANRVQEISIKLASALSLEDERIATLSTAALLHDVGKIGISTEILNKPGRLTNHEYELVKRHPENAKTILDEIEGFDEISYFAYCHHEHYDGSGYPRGLSHHEVPIESQIIQIADAYDAMTSDRSYRKKFSGVEALEIIRSERGRQFNPMLVDVLFELRGEI